MNKTEQILVILFFLLFSVNTVMGEYRIADTRRNWSFPEDHGSHPDFKTEWWYFTGHLKSKSSVYGFELTFFRFANDGQFAKRSEWSADQLYLTHFTVTDEDEGKFYKYETVNRGALGIAGSATDTLHVWNGSYSVEIQKGIFKISASSPHINLELRLKRSSEIVLNGNNGLSRKGPRKGEASYYYSIPRLEGEGSLEIKKRKIIIEDASVWMDREFFSIPESGNRGWDWFAIQLDDGSDLMLYSLRNKEGKKTEFSSGTFLDPKGKKKILNSSDFFIVCTMTAISTYCRFT